MADEEDYGNWDDEGFEAPEVNVVRKEAEPVDLTLLDAKKREEEEAKRRAEEAAKPKAAPKLEGGGGSSSSSSSSAFDSSNMTEAQREEAQRRAEAASTQEMVGGLVTASRCSEWVPKLIVASVADMEQMGKALAERIHSVSEGGGVGGVQGLLLPRGTRPSGATRSLCVLALCSLPSLSLSLSPPTHHSCAPLVPVAACADLPCWHGRPQVLHCHAVSGGAEDGAD
jgi:hypothetical protein